MRTQLNTRTPAEANHSSALTPFFQPKLTINQPNDIYEQEADAMADKVMRMPDSLVNNNSFFKPSTIQRKCAHCEEEEKTAQRKETNNDVTSSSTQTEDYINSLSGGRSLNDNERNFFESKMGYDFSDVKIHTDADAARSARSINALAYTNGKNIVFNDGQFKPDTDSGKKLMAHELTHVVQQTRAIKRLPAIQRFTTSDCGITQNTLINNAVTTAQTNLRTVITQLRTRPLTTDIENALWLYFRDTSATTADAVANNLDRIKSGISGLSYECENDCAENELGYTRLGTMITSLGSIHVCMNNLGADSANVANTVIHESAHYFLLANDSFGYYGNDCEESEETVRAGSSSKLSLADSYSCMVKNWINGTAFDRADARTDISGTNFAGISQSPAGVIDLNSSTPKRPLFAMRLNRGPAAIVTGVSYRWSLRDDQDRSYLMTNTSGDVLFEYKPALESVLAIINRGTRNLLKERGIRSGRVLCRANSPVFGDRLFETPVSFTF